MNELEIFTEALRCPDRAQRDAYLDQACGTDVALRGRIAQLLALHESGHPLLDRRPGELIKELEKTTQDADAGPPSPESAAGQLAPFLAPSARPGALGRLGHYDVLAVLGRGGFGIV